MTQPDAAPESTVDATTPKRFPHWRRWTAGTLVVVSCILVPLSIVAVFVRGQLLDTERYVENVTPLASDPAIISTAAAGITDALFTRVDVEARAEAVLPSALDFLAAPLETALHERVVETATTILSSEKFRTVWIDANERAHDQIVRSLTGTGKYVSIGSNDKIVLDLTAIVLQVRQALSEHGIKFFDTIPINRLAFQFELGDADQLAKAQQLTHRLDQLRWVLPVLVFLFLGIAVWLSPNRRRTLMRWGVGAAVAAAVVGAGVAFGRSLYLDAVTSPALPSATAAAVFDTLVRFLRYSVRLMVAVGLLVAFGAWVSGPSRAAERLRATSRSVVGGAGTAAGSHGFGFGRFGDWVARTRGPLRVTCVLGMLVVLLLWNHPRGGTVLLLGLVLLVLLGLLEFIARAAAVDDPTPDADADGPPVLGASTS